MEGERVDRPYVIHVVNGLTVAFERVFLFLCFLGRVKVFDRNPTFRRARGKPYGLRGTQSDELYMM